MFTRISKSAARKLFNERKEFYICPVKFRPEFSVRVMPGGSGVPMGAPRWDSFEAYVNAFSFYNCSNETGRYPAYYIHN